jgi:hypothetical protein
MEFIHHALSLLVFPCEVEDGVVSRVLDKLVTSFAACNSASNAAAAATVEFTL